MPGKRKDSHTIAVTERRAKVLAYRKAGATHRAIADALGVDHSTIVRDVQAMFAELAAQQQAESGELRTLEAARLDDMQAAVWQQARTGNLKAVQTTLHIMERRARMFGLDAAPKVPLNPDGTPAQYAELRTIVLGLLPMEQRLLLADALDKVIDVSATDRPNESA